MWSNVRMADAQGALYIDAFPFPVTRWEAVRHPDGTLLDLVCTAVNDTAVAQFARDFPGIELLGLRFRSELDGPLADRGLVRPARVIATATPEVVDAAFPSVPDRWFEVILAPSGDGVVVMMRDVSQRHQALLALEASEQRFRGTMETLFDAVFILEAAHDGADGSTELQFEYVNPAGARLIGTTPDAIIGRTYHDVFPDSTTGAVRRYLEAMATGQPLQFDVPWVETGSLRGSFEIHALPLDERRLVVVAHDVTGRLQAQQEARSSERQFRMMADHAGDVVIALRQGVIEWAAPSVERLMGWTVDEVVGRASLDFVHPDDAPMAEAVRWHPAAATKIRCRVAQRDGGWRWVDLVGRVAGPDGEPEHPLVLTVIDAQAEVEARDALQRAEEERQRLQQHVEESVRLESLSQLAGGVAHDFNNLLVGILGNAELALQDLPPDSSVRSRLVSISNAAQRAAELTRQLLDFTGRQPRDRMPLDITSLVADTVDLARSMTTRDVPVTVHASGSTAAVVGDRSQLQQVVMNLLVNAIDAVDPHTGRIDVSTRVRQLADDSSTLGLPGGDYVVISVSDNGRGIDPEHQRRIFDPFFTTRSGGRGLGLAVVGGIVRSHSGAVDVRSTPGAGAVFDVLLPASALPLEVPSTPMSFRLRRQPTVLVVDDDDEVRDVTGDILRRAGFQVLSESRGRDAISTFASRHATIDAVVLDLMMPDVTGDEVMVVLRAVEPGIPIVVISGYLDHDPLSEAATMKCTDHVRKPFLPEDLVEAVRRSLHQTPFVFPDDADGPGAGMLFEPRPPRLDG